MHIIVVIFSLVFTRNNLVMFPNKIKYFFGKICYTSLRLGILHTIFYILSCLDWHFYKSTLCHVYRGAQCHISQK